VVGEAPAFLTGPAARGATTRPAGFTSAAFVVFVVFAGGKAFLAAALAGALATGRLAVAVAPDAAAAGFFFGSAFAIFFPIRPSLTGDRLTPLADRSLLDPVRPSFRAGRGQIVGAGFRRSTH